MIPLAYRADHAFALPPDGESAPARSATAGIVSAHLIVSGSASAAFHCDSFSRLQKKRTDKNIPSFRGGCQIRRGLLCRESSERDSNLLLCGLKRPGGDQSGFL